MTHNVQVTSEGKSFWVTAIHIDCNGISQLIVIDPNTVRIKKLIQVGKDLHVANVVLDNESKYAFVRPKDLQPGYTSRCYDPSNDTIV